MSSGVSKIYYHDEVKIKIFGLEIDPALFEKEDPVQETPVYSLPPEVTAMLKRLGDKRFAGSMNRAAARSSRAIPPRRYSSGGWGHYHSCDRERARMAKPSNVRHWAIIMQRREA